ncbi:hypothetical protein SO802_002447 [Lithocarpus litseifolius]|uniref:Uncharacterized protein n=1 Tax=Lithocarpus litseifolius TaxID=425828 RepID=A0AAW2DXK2_9ROSI
MSRLSEEDQLSMVVKNLLPMYHKYLYAQYFPNFKALIAARTQIEDALNNGTIKTDDPPRFKKNVGSKVAEISNIHKNDPYQLIAPIAPVQYSGNDWGEPPSDREDEDTDLFYEDYYDQDIEDDVEANRWSDVDSDQYRLMNVFENAREANAQANQMYHEEYPYGHLSDWSDITNVSSRSGPRYDKHGSEVPELGPYYDSEPNSPTTEEEDDIDARLAALDHKLMVHSLRIMTLESAKCSDESEKGGVLEHLPQPTNLGNKGKHDLFDEWMDSIERLDAFVVNKPIDMEIKEEAMDDMDSNPTILMLRAERAY